jgi:hypothetical protein
LEEEIDRNSAIQNENMLLKQMCYQLEFVTRKMMENNKKIEMLHRQEIRWREEEELGLVMAVGVCAMLCVLLSLTTRDFV